MAPKLNITHIGTATAILEINGVNMLTDPFFSPAGTSFPITHDSSLDVNDDPALRLDQLPVIDAVLLSHEVHVDNLDKLDRQLLNGRRVFTTVDGAKNISPRPAVHGFQPWEILDVEISCKKFTIVGTPTSWFLCITSRGIILRSLGRRRSVIRCVGFALGRLSRFFDIPE